MKFKSYFFCLVLVILLVACSSKSTYYPGFFVNNIFGNISFEDSTTNYQATFILIFAYQNIGIGLEEGQNLSQKRAYLILPNQKGDYFFPVLNKGQEFEFYFYSQNFISQASAFSQTVGVRKIEHSIIFKKDNNWQSSYNLYIRPTLSEILAEPKYGLAVASILFLSNWLEKVEQTNN